MAAQPCSSPPNARFRRNELIAGGSVLLHPFLTLIPTFTASPRPPGTPTPTNTALGARGLRGEPGSAHRREAGEQPAWQPRASHRLTPPRRGPGRPLATHSGKRRRAAASPAPMGPPASSLLSHNQRYKETESSSYPLPPATPSSFPAELLAGWCLLQGRRLAPENWGVPLFVETLCAGFGVCRCRLKA